METYLNKYEVFNKQMYRNLFWKDQLDMLRFEPERWIIVFRYGVRN